MSEDSVGDTPQSALTIAPDSIELEGRTYSLLGYDSAGRPHYHLNGEMTNREHIVRAEAEYRRVGWLSDGQAADIEKMLHDGYQAGGCHA